MQQSKGKLIKVIHVAKRQLCIEEDSYRAILLNLTKKKSLTEMSYDDLNNVIKHFKKLGFRVKANRKEAGTRPLADHPQAKKIRALWLFMHEIGIVRDPSERALASYAKRITGIDALQWILDTAKTNMVIESLKKWVVRYLPNIIATEYSKTKNCESYEFLLLTNKVQAALIYGTFDRLEAALVDIKNYQDKHKE